MDEIAIIRVNIQNNSAVNIGVKSESMSLGKVIKNLPHTIQPGTNHVFVVRALSYLSFGSPISSYTDNIIAIPI